MSGQLVLTRLPGEAIIIGENITVRVLRVRGGQVQIGIDAPRDIRVDREEIRERINRENAAKSAPVTRKAPEFAQGARVA